MSDLLRTRPASTAEMIAIFSDRATISYALAFWTALARAEAQEGLIDAEAADEIERACADAEIDPTTLAEEAAFAGTLAIPLVNRLRAMLPEHVAPALHKGASSQDVADTVLMLQMAAAARRLSGDLARVSSALFTLAERYANVPAIGRTLLQDAAPVGFGLRLAQAAIGISVAARRLDGAVSAGACLQLGGAAGTRAGLGGKGAAIAAHMARALSLVPAEPWHARRVDIAAIAAAGGIVIGALGKFARDVSLLAQNAIGEAREPAVAGRGGSSAMAHKRNPTGCQVALSAAIRAPGLVAGILSGLPQEEERGLGGWQAEGPALSELFLLAAGAAQAMAAVAEGLEIDEAAIARNVASAGQGSDIGESAAIVAALIQRRT